MRLAVTLTIILCAAFYGLLLLGAFAGPWLGQRVVGSIPLSFVLGVAYIIGAFALTTFYAWRANAAETRA